jgi:hypothetical protein
MRRVIETDAKTLQPRKRFNSAGIYVSMANRADGTFFMCELLRVTPNARSVAGSARQRWPRRVALAPVTQQARHARVMSAGMNKL